MRLYIAVLMILFLSACAGPKYHTRVIDEPKSKDLRPWEKPYQVNGERYQPLPKSAHAGYVEEGIASWYGGHFHGRRTSNGEVYDMHGRTAAHKTLPLGVYVKVKNLSNGREVEARINDRGPFVKGRIIDLSQTLARELDMIAAGTAPVRIEALGFRESGAGGAVAWRQPKSYTPDSYAVQIGSFGVRENAERLATAMRARYGAASVAEGWVEAKLFYRVRVGSYKNLEAAEKAKAQFERDGYANSFVVAME